jgi:mono/diheme cytochrome c family protein
MSLGLIMLLAAAMPLSANDVDVPNTVTSINKGRLLYMTLCTACHGHDGKAQIDVVSNATDLTDPGAYNFGSDVASIDKSIRDGVGATMPAWGPTLRDPADIGHLRNYLRSLWPQAQRPAVVNQ